MIALGEYGSTDPTPVTYAALQTALVQLGFDVILGPDYRLYFHKPTDTRILMPDFPYGQAADEIRLITVRKMVVERGIARRARLERPPAPPAGPAPPGPCPHDHAGDHARHPGRGEGLTASPRPAE